MQTPLLPVVWVSINSKLVGMELQCSNVTMWVLTANTAYSILHTMPHINTCTFISYTVKYKVTPGPQVKGNNSDKKQQYSRLVSDTTKLRQQQCNGRRMLPRHTQDFGKTWLMVQRVIHAVQLKTTQIYSKNIPSNVDSSKIG